VDAEARARILELATDFPRLWYDFHTPDRERKRMVRLLLEDVTVVKTTDGLTVHLRFSGWRDHHAHTDPSAERMAAPRDQCRDRRIDRSAP
jgi:hypothetical protein